jgi:hypothetical protein
MTPTLENLLLDAAFRRYRRDCKADARIVDQQPAADSGTVTPKHVTVRNCTGVLARYAWTTAPTQRPDRFRVRLTPA